MNLSLLSRPRTPLWPTPPKRAGTHRNAMPAAVLAAIAIEGALVALALSVRVPAAPPTPPAPVMQMRFVEKVTPPPPPKPVVRKIVQQASEAPSPQPAAAPVPAPPRRAKPRHTTAPHRAVRPAPTPMPVPAPAPAAIEPVPPPAAAPPAVPTAPADPAPAQVHGPSKGGAPAAADIAVVCPVQAKPEMPARAVADGIAGKVTARATILGGKVARVDIIRSTPPGVFDASVRRAMSSYRCEVEGDAPVVVEQSFDFAETDE